MKEERRKWVEKYYEYLLGPYTTPEKQIDAMFLKIDRLCDLKFLYKYRDIKQTKEQILKPLREGKPLEIRLSHPSDFNDPFDTRTPLKYFNSPNIRLQNINYLHGVFYICTKQGTEIEDKCWSELENSLQIEDFENWKNEESNIIRKYWPPDNTDEKVITDVVTLIKNSNYLAQQGLDKELGISCFSETPESLLMWSHYAEQHKGICLAYDTTQFFLSFQERHFINEVNPVRYYNNISDMIHEHNRKLGGDQLTQNEEGLLKKVLMTKAEDWSYEMEWRLSICSTTEFFGPPKRDDGYHYLPLFPSCIYLGVKIDDTLKSEIYELAGKYGIQVKEMKMEDDTFELIVGD